MPEPAAPAARAGRVSVEALFPAQADVSTLPAFAARVEDWGYDELWVVEDCFLSGGLVMAAGALAATESLKVGLGLMPSPLRNPLLAAMEIGALATMHPGRFTATFGHGVREWMRQAGAAPARPLAALGEVVSAVRALLRGETVSVQGSHVRLDGVALHSPPEHAPPVLIGSTGPRGLALARDLADGVLLPEGCSPAFIAQALRTAARPARLQSVAYVWLALDDDGPRARLALRPALERWLALDIYPGPLSALGPGDAALPDDVGPELAGQLALAGPPAACAAAASRFAGAGLDTIVVTAVGADHEGQYEWFARDVLPLPARR